MWAGVPHAEPSIPSPWINPALSHRDLGALFMPHIYISFQRSWAHGHVRTPSRDSWLSGGQDMPQQSAACGQQVVTKLYGPRAGNMCCQWHGLMESWHNSCCYLMHDVESWGATVKQCTSHHLDSSCSLCREKNNKKPQKVFLNKY